MCFFAHDQFLHINSYSNIYIFSSSPSSLSSSSAFSSFLCYRYILHNHPMNVFCKTSNTTSLEESSLIKMRKVIFKKEFEYYIDDERGSKRYSNNFLQYITLRFYSLLFKMIILMIIEINQYYGDIVNPIYNFIAKQI